MPHTQSLYGELRREPRRECLSTIETIAESLSSLGEPAETGTALKALFTQLLEAYRQNYGSTVRKGATDRRVRRKR